MLSVTKLKLKCVTITKIMVPPSRIIVYILYYAIIILNYAHIFAYGTISRVSSRILDYGVMNKRVLHFAFCVVSNVSCPKDICII